MAAPGPFWPQAVCVTPYNSVTSSKTISVCRVMVSRRPRCRIVSIMWYFENMIIHTDVVVEAQERPAEFYNGKTNRKSV